MAEPSNAFWPGAQSRPPELAPAAIPDHQLLRLIARGSYGEVWLAKSSLGTFRAIKIVHQSTFRDPRPFERELSGVQKFEPVSRLHEGLMDVLQVGRNPVAGYFYCVVELADDAVRGQAVDPDHYTPRTLAQEMAGGKRLPVEACLQVGITICSALGFLHARGLIHRDVKPSNIVFVQGVPKLADVGLVVEMSEARSYVGTEGFIPPEGPGTVQADLYSLGKVLYEMSTGKDRYAFPELPTLLDQTSHSQELLEFNRIILKACRAEPRTRYRSADQMLADLQALQRGEPIPARRGARRWARWSLKWASRVASLALGWILLGRWQSVSELRVAGSGSTTSRPVPVPSRLVAWWRGEGNLKDEAGTNHGRTVFDDVTFAPGKVGQAFAFNGVNQFVQVSDTPSLNPTNGLTLETWVFLSGYSANDSVAIVAKDDVFVARQYLLGLVQVQGRWLIRSGVGVTKGFSFVDGATALQINTWYHIAMTHDGATLQIYLNGQLDGALAVAGQLITTTQPLRIGGAGFGPWYFPGRVDELALYDRALPSGEILAIYCRGSLGKCVTSVAPVTTSQPVGQTVTVGAE